jgi:hypothetical protein
MASVTSLALMVTFARATCAEPFYVGCTCFRFFGQIARPPLETTGDHSNCGPLGSFTFARCAPGHNHHTNYNCRASRLSPPRFSVACARLFWLPPVATDGFFGPGGATKGRELPEASTGHCGYRRSMVDARDLNPAANSLQIPKRWVLPPFRCIRSVVSVKSCNFVFREVVFSFDYRLHDTQRRSTRLSATARSSRRIR